MWLDANEIEALRLSLAVASRSVAFSLPAAIAVAWVLTRRRFLGRTLLDAVVHLPLVLPPVLVGYLLLVVFGARGVIGSWLERAFGIELVFTRNGAALATAVMSFPMMVRAIRLSLETVDRGLENAARTLGAGAVDRFATITLPLMLPGILAGAITAFSAALGEFGAVITFVSNIPGETRTLPLALYTALQSPGGEHAAARLACVSLALGLAGLFAVGVVRAARAPPVGPMMLAVDAAKRLGDFTLNVRFDLPTPGVVALFGRSGCGKSTVINMIAGLLAPGTGRIALDDTLLLDTARRVDLPPERRRMGYVFQDARLFPHLGVAANLRYAEKRAAGAPYVTLEAVVALLDLRSLMDRRTHQLSGGERQRVAIGRALLSQPRLLLLDEPLAALDGARREEVLPYLETLRDKLAIPMVYVTHRFDEVLRLATHIVLMEAGTVVAQGGVGEMSLNDHLRSLIGPDEVGAIIEGRVLGKDPVSQLIRVQVGSGEIKVPAQGLGTAGLLAGTTLRIQLLARDLIVSTQMPEHLSVRNTLAGNVTHIQGDGDSDLVTIDVGAIDTGATPIVARITQAATRELSLRTGMPVWALVKSVSLRGHRVAAPSPRSASSH